MTSAAAFTARNGLAYGLMGLPLAFVALPLYVVLPNHYATTLGVPLAVLGQILLGARLFDGLIDPLLGRWGDALFARPTHASRAVLGVAAGAAVVMALGFWGLFFPATQDHVLLWAAALLVVTYTAYSTLGVLHQAWAGLLGGTEAQRSRIVAWREGLGLVGVVTASVAPVLLGLPTTVGLLALSLGLGWWAWSHAIAPAPQIPSQTRAALWLPLHNPAFRRLLGVFMVNGIASAVPATLVLFFMQDRLLAPQALQPLFLATYFVCAALSIPLWLRLVPRLGLARTWLVGMGVAVAAFVGASLLGAGDSTAFLAVCAASGIALGTDLALPSALLAGLVQKQGGAGLYFGWWNFATKLNLALAAGLALPLLAYFGYTPGAQDAAALHALTATYCLLPCALKLAAAAALYLLIIRPKDSP
ncbi:MFS transporter [Rhodoferax sp. WC2427]|uniref:MFS transporter n=1 Tax=Rhodoferax sp. WC2427 TaxID=3234144 RepID=UPI0034674E8F